MSVNTHPVSHTELLFALAGWSTAHELGIRRIKPSGTVLGTNIAALLALVPILLWPASQYEAG